MKKSVDSTSRFGTSPLQRVSGADPARLSKKRLSGVLCAALALTACAHHPQPQIITRDVKIPIPVKCVPDGVPAPQTYAADAIPLDSDIFALVKALLIEREERKVAELNLRSAVEGCR